MTRVVIIGGGVSGLGLAHELSASPEFQITVIERSAVVGGLAGSVSFEDWQLDVGSHRIHPKSHPVALQLLRDLLGDDLRSRPRHGQLRFQGRWLSYPPSTVELALSYDPLALATLVGSWMAARLRIAAPTETFESVLTHKFGRRLFEDFYHPYARKLWGLDPGEISAIAAEQRAQRLSMPRLVGDLHRWLTSSAPAHTYLYPAEGFGMIARQLERRLVARGVTILRHTRAEALRLAPNGRASHVATVCEQSGEPIDVGADWVVSTAPLPFNLQLLERSGCRPLSPAPQLSTRHLRVVLLSTEDVPKTPGETLYIPGDRKSVV